MISPVNIHKARDDKLIILSPPQKQAARAPWLVPGSPAGDDCGPIGPDWAGDVCLQVWLDPACSRMDQDYGPI